MSNQRIGRIAAQRQRRNRFKPAEAKAIRGEIRSQIRECERPEPSVIWQTLGIAFGSFAFTTGLAALTISDQVAARPAELWIATAGFLVAALLSFAAHRDVNRGRRSKWFEVEELPSADRDR